MKISVALCTYNGELYLKEQLDSMVAQTRLPDELIVVDDCSSDNTVSLVEYFAKEAPFTVRLFINKQNLGVNGNFSRAISLCSGDIIFTADYDNVWVPEKLAKTEAIFQDEPNVGLVFTDAQIVDEELKPLGMNLKDLTISCESLERFYKGEAIDLLLVNNFIGGSTMAFRACFNPIVLPIPRVTTMYHDLWIPLVIAAHAKLKFIDEPLIRYRQHRNQWSATFGAVKKALSKNGAKSILLYEAFRRVPAETYQEIINPKLLQLNLYADLREAFEEKQKSITEIKTKLTDSDIQPDFDYLLSKVKERVSYINGLIKHYKVRQALPNSRVKRILPVIKELRSKRYHQHSKGFATAVKDLVL